MAGIKNIKARNYYNFDSKNFFLTSILLISILVVTSLFQNWHYQGRTYIWDAFFNFLKLQILITDSSGYLTEELLSRIPVFTEHHLALL